MIVHPCASGSEGAGDAKWKVARDPRLVTAAGSDMDRASRPARRSASSRPRARTSTRSPGAAHSITVAWIATLLRAQVAAVILGEAGRLVVAAKLDEGGDEIHRDVERGVVGLERHGRERTSRRPTLGQRLGRKLGPPPPVERVGEGPAQDLDRLV